MKKAKVIWLAVILLAGCGGGRAPVIGEEREVAFGPITTRVVGTAQPAVTSSGFGAVVTGVAGATISSMVLHDNAPSLDDTLIAFASNRDGNFEIYVMNADGSNVTRLTNNAATDRDPAFSPDRSKITFISNRDGNSEVYVMNADGTNQTRLTKGLFASRPVFSPDGSTIAFAGTSGGKLDIFLMNVNGSNLTPLTNNPADDFAPAFSPDGSKIAFTSDRDGNSVIYVINANGTSQSRLTDKASVNFDPAFSPDGSKIAFSSNRDVNFEIYVMNANGTNQVRLTNNGATDTVPTWSPFLTKRLLVGPDGPLGTTAAGFLFAQKGKSIPAIVTFDATTRGGTRVNTTTPGSTNGPNLVFEVTAADSLTSLRYLIGSSSLATSVIGAGGSVTSATNALVSFDAADGVVTSVLPYSANRSAPSSGDTTRQGDVLVYRRRFLGVWDGAGRNRAVEGAQEVRIDARTGRLLSFR